MTHQLAVKKALHGALVVAICLMFFEAQAEEARHPFIVRNSPTTAEEIFQPVLPQGTAEHDGYRSIMVVPQQSSGGQTAAYAYYGLSRSATSQLVGEWGIIKCLATGARCWDLNPTITDTVDNTTQNSFAAALAGAEFDFSVYNPGSNICGICLTGSSAVQPAGADGFVVGNLHAASPGRIKWTHGFVVNDGTAKIGFLIGAQDARTGVSDGIPSYLNYKASHGERAITIQAGSSGDLRFGDTGALNGIALRPNADHEALIETYGADPDRDLALAAKGQAAIVLRNPVKLAPFTVATLPACTGALKSAMAAVSDAKDPAYNGALHGGGTSDVPVYCNGRAWTAH